MSFFLSKLCLNPCSRDVARDLGNPYDMHRTLLRAFPDAAVGGAGRVRYRLEPTSNGPRTVLVQSEKQPDWRALPANYLICPAEHRRVDRLDFPEGRALRFRVRANPTKRVAVQSKGSDGQPIDPRWIGKRIGLWGEEDQLEWLRRKGELGGFRVLECTPRREPLRTCFKKGMAIDQLSVMFEGVLAVTDTEKFRETLREGVGSAKGFGFGMLSVPLP